MARMSTGLMTLHSLTGRTKASIASLPVELLIVIFKDIHKQRRSVNSDWKPISLACVCSFWRGVMALIPEFWTSILIFINDSFFSVPHITSLLTRSRDLIIDVNVMMGDEEPSMNDECERGRVMSVFEVLGPHIWRCRLLFFDVRFSSSLPSFPGDFHGRAEHLQLLKLDCLEDNGGANYVAGETNILQDDREQFRCPKLGVLCIDGRNYFNACQSNPHWTNMLPNLYSIFISHFTPVATRSESFSTLDFLRSLVPLRKKLESIAINDLDLHEPPNLVYENMGNFYVSSLEFENMPDANSVEAIMDFLGDPADLHIIGRCSVPINLFQGILSLDKIDSSEDIVEYLREYRGAELKISNCPGFDDSVIMAMMNLEPTTFDDLIDYCAPSVRHLTIHDCPNFSTPALKLLVAMRCFDHVQGQIPTLSEGRIAELELTGRVPEISAKDNDWFQKWTPEFTYDRC